MSSIDAQGLRKAFLYAAVTRHPAVPVHKTSQKLLKQKRTETRTGVSTLRQFEKTPEFSPLGG